MFKGITGRVGYGVTRVLRHRAPIVKLSLNRTRNPRLLKHHC